MIIKYNLKSCDNNLNRVRIYIEVSYGQWASATLPGVRYVLCWVRKELRLQGDQLTDPAFWPIYILPTDY
jgi:hypothetical protein